MRYTAVYGVLVLIAVACAVQNNPLPEDQPNDNEGGSGDAGGTKASAGKATQTGGSVSTSGTASGGKEDNGGSMSEGGSLGGKAGSNSGGKAGTGSAGKASGGSAGKSSGGAGGSSAGSSSGGKGGSGGTSNSGGSAGSAGSGCIASTSGPIQGVSARYQGEITGASGSGIGAQLALYNSGQSSLNLTDLKLRYYFTNEVQASLNKTINWAWYRPISGGGQDDKQPKVSFNVVPMTCKSASADSYLEFTFTADAGLLEAGHYLLFSWQANNSASQNFNQGNDYSFDAASKVDADDTKIVILQNSGARIWGTEP
jgi:hypothetical protein